MHLESTVFFIEEDVAVRDAISISLTMASFKIEVYPSGKAFLDACTEDRPGCLLINLSQPQTDGLAVQQELIRRNFLIPIIFMTGIGTFRGGASGILSGAFCLLEKPFSRQLLLDCINAAMEKDCGNRPSIETQTETDGHPPNSRSDYKRLSLLERKIRALIKPGKSDDKLTVGILKPTWITEAC